MAVSIQCPNFVSHNAVQYLLSQAWTGSVKGPIHFYDVALAILFPFYVRGFDYHDNGQFIDSLIFERKEHSVDDTEIEINRYDKEW